MDAALGHVSAAGSGTPEFDVTHSGGGPRAFVASQSGGNAGGPTLSKLSLNPTGMEQGGGHEGVDRGVAARWAMTREELIALTILVPVSAVLSLSNLEHLILVLTTMLVVLVEFLNSAIETTVDRISLEPHPLAGQAKDLGSAAVFIAVLMWGLTWLVIVGPLVMGLFRKLTA